MKFLFPVVVLFLGLLNISWAKSCSSCRNGCCDYYGDCAEYRSDCSYSCYYCRINGDCGTYNECNSSSAATIIIVICVLSGAAIVGFAICFYIRRKRRQKIDLIRQNHLQAQLNAQNNTQNNTNTTQEIAIGYPLPENNQYAYQIQHPQNQVAYSGNIAYGQILANQHPTQQYQCTIPAGEAIPNYQVTQQHPQHFVQPGYPVN